MMLEKICLNNTESFVRKNQIRIEEKLSRYIPPSFFGIDSLQQAMLYSLFAGGKRLRPLLIYATGKALRAKINTLDIPAMAIECLHTFSLIHDDLPCMDNADLRRGKPTCHKQFGEAMAVLAGDALQTLAFEILAEAPSSLNAQQRLKMIALLAKASGYQGMALGQVCDMQQSKTPSLDFVRHLYQAKTGDLIKASVQMAVIASGCQSKRIFTHLSDFADCLGLAFQIQDDILDIESEASSLGKDTKIDEKLDKKTIPSLIGLQAAKNEVISLHQQAFTHLSQIQLQNSILAHLANLILFRKN